MRLARNSKGRFLSAAATRARRAAARNHGGRKMARKSAVVRYIPRARRAVARVGAYARSQKAVEKHRLYAVGASALIGYLNAEGTLAKMPHIQGLGRVGTLGALCWLGSKFTKSKGLDGAATGLLSVAAYQLARTKGEGIEGELDEGAAGLDELEGDVEGDEE